jgi:hypothetical protein
MRGRFVSGDCDLAATNSSAPLGHARFVIDAEAVESYRVQLEEMADGVPYAEAVVEHFSDWQVVQAMESLWAAGSPWTPLTL